MTRELVRFLTIALTAAFLVLPTVGGVWAATETPGLKDCSGGDDDQQDTAESGAFKTRNPRWRCPNGCTWGSCGHSSCGEKWLCPNSKLPPDQTPKAPPSTTQPKPTNAEKRENRSDALHELIAPGGDAQVTAQRQDPLDADLFEDAQGYELLPDFWYPQMDYLPAPQTEVDPSFNGESGSFVQPPAPLASEGETSTWDRLGGAVDAAATALRDAGTEALDSAGQTVNEGIKVARDLAGAVLETHDSLTDDIALGLERTVNDAKDAGQSAYEAYDSFTDDVAVGIERTVNDAKDAGQSAYEAYDSFTDDVAVGIERTVNDAKDAGQSAYETYDSFTDDVAVGIERTVSDSKSAAQAVEYFGYAVATGVEPPSPDLIAGIASYSLGAASAGMSGKTVGEFWKMKGGKASTAAVTLGSAQTGYDVGRYLDSQSGASDFWSDQAIDWFGPHDIDLGFNPDRVLDGYSGPPPELIVEGTTFGLGAIGAWQTGTTLGSVGVLGTGSAVIGSGLFGWHLGRAADEWSGASDFWSDVLLKYAGPYQRPKQLTHAEQIMKDFNQGGTGVKGLH